MFLEEFTTYIKYFLMTNILRIEVLHGQYFHVFYLRLLKKDPTKYRIKTFGVAHLYLRPSDRPLGPKT